MVLRKAHSQAECQKGEEDRSTSEGLGRAGWQRQKEGTKRERSTYERGEGREVDGWYFGGSESWMSARRLEARGH